MTKNRQKKVLVSGYIGFSNFGDDALLYVLSNHLKAKGCEVTAFSSNPKATEHNYGIKSVYYKSPAAILKAILNTDILVSGGGNLIQNETGNLSLFYYLFIILLAKFFSKKVIIFSQGIGPVIGKFQRLISKLVLKTADLIIVRDIYSQRILAKWGINSKYAHDAVWDIKTPFHKPENILGLQVRDYKFLNNGFYSNLAKYVDMHFSEYKIKIFSMQNQNDASECYKLEKALKSRNSFLKTEVVLYKNPQQIIEEFSNLKYLIAMRLHANVLGLKYGIRILPVSYSVKVRNFAYEFDLPYIEASEDCSINDILTNLTASEQANFKIESARKRTFEWAHFDKVIDN